MAKPAQERRTEQVDGIAGSKTWADYNAAQAGRPVRPLCLDARAFAGAGNGRQALDLSCGAGKETLALLSEGWRVHAVDSLTGTRERLLAIFQGHEALAHFRCDRPPAGRTGRRIAAA